jgi:septal ring factor EnvC (AmiA/AmiB activator)
VIGPRSLALLLALHVADPGAGSSADEEGFGGQARAPDVAADQQTAEEAQQIGLAEKTAMRKRVAEDRVRSQFLRGEESSIFKAIDELDRSVAVNRRRMLEIGKKQVAIEKDIARVDAELHGSRTRLAALRVEIGRRAAAMLRFRRTPLSELVARARSPAAARTLRERLAIVLAFDRDLIVRIEKESAAGERLAADLVERKAALEKARLELATENEESLTLREERAALLRAVQGERKMIERLAAEIATAARRLDSELGVVHGANPAPAAAAGGFSRQRGRLPWPVVGRVEVTFGKRVDPESDAVIAHKGLDLRAPADEPVRAVFAGRVAYASTLHGFGRVVILDHGENWFSVYAHLEDVEVAPGAEVAARQAIGTVGETGSIKGPYLYFELRHGQEAVDPTSWLAR